MAKTNFNMQLTETQKNIMDFTAGVIFEDRLSKASVVMELFRNCALSYLDFPDDCGDLSDEFLYSMLLSRKKEEDSKLIGFMGTFAYKKLIDGFKKADVNYDSSYQDELLEDYIAQYGETNKSNVIIDGGNK